MRQNITTLCTAYRQLISSYLYSKWQNKYETNTSMVSTSNPKLQNEKAPTTASGKTEQTSYLDTRLTHGQEIQYKPKTGN